jgi:restriction system protein
MADTFEQGYWPAPDIAQFYDAAIYQTCFRTLHELFAADEAEVIDSVTFNGWVNFTDKVHGRPARACILSVQVPKTALKQVNLSVADLKALFKSWKGVAGANLADMATIDPVLPLKKTDNRPLPANDMTEKGAGRQPPPVPGSKERG